MRVMTLVLVGLAACGGDDFEQYPIVPGGGGVGGGGTFGQQDAGTEDGGNTISGRVCLVSDARLLTTCAATTASGLTVTLAGNTATTAADGSFTIAKPSSTDLTWKVTGTGIIASAMDAADGNTIPTISQTLYQQMVTQTQTTDTSASGAIIAKLTHNGTPVVGATVTSTPSPAGMVYYDGDTAAQWSPDATGSFGVVWVPGVQEGSARLNVAGSTTGTLTNIPVATNTITYVFGSI